MKLRTFTSSTSNDEDEFDLLRPSVSKVQFEASKIGRTSSYRSAARYHDEDRHDEDDYGHQEEDQRQQISDIMRQASAPRERMSHQHMPRRSQTNLGHIRRVPSSASRELEDFYRKRSAAPVKANTFPASSNSSVKSTPISRQAYPKEKWVRPAPSLLRVESVTDNTVDSMDDFLKQYTQYGKYEVDKTSLINSKLRDPNDWEDDRYEGYFSPDRSYSSDDGIALWRSEDEESSASDRSSEEDDWDEDVVHSRKAANRKISVRAVSTYDDDEHTESFEMMSYDPDETQTLNSDHRVHHQHDPLTPSASFVDKVVDKASKQLAKKMEKKLKKELKKQKKKEKRYKKRKKALKRERSGDGKKKSDLKDKLRTMSLVSHSSNASAAGNKSHESDGSVELNKLQSDEDKKDTKSVSSSSSLSIQQQKSFREQHRQEHRRWVRKRKDGAPYPRLDNPSDEEEVSLSNASTGSLSTTEQRRFRKKKRKEHLKWLEQRKNERARYPYHGSQDESDSEYASGEDLDEASAQRKKRSSSIPVSLQAMPSMKSSYTEDTTIPIKKTRGSKSVRKFFGGLFRWPRSKPKKDRVIDELMAKFDSQSSQQATGEGGESAEDESETDDSLRFFDRRPKPDYLPWEKEKDNEAEKPKGLVQQVLANFQPQTEEPAPRTVEDLPFPQSDSYDSSLAKLDKYGDITDGLPTLVPGEEKEYGDAKFEPQISSEFSEESSTAIKKKPIQRAKKGLGNSVKKLFIKK
eukprot:Sro488_g153140.2  (747) ;mRNA; f:41647-43887